MDEKKKSRISTMITAVALGELILVVGFSIYGTFRHILQGNQSEILTGVGLFFYWLLMDVAEPLLLHRFDDITAERKTAYLKFVAFDFAGLAGIAYFLFGMNGSNSSILGAVIYAVSIKPKRDNQDIFWGLKSAQEEEEDLPEEKEKELPEEKKEELPEKKAEELLEGEKQAKLREPEE